MLPSFLSALLFGLAALRAAGQAIDNPNTDACQMRLQHGSGDSAIDVTWGVGLYDHGDDYSQFLQYEVTLIANLEDHPDVTNCWLYLQNGDFFFNQQLVIPSVTDGLAFNFSSGDSFTLPTGYDHIQILYESTHCIVEMFETDNFGTQLGGNLGIAGTYNTVWMEARGVWDDAMSSLKILGDSTCYVEAYKHPDCDVDDLMATVVGPGSYSKAALELLGYNELDSGMSCFKVKAASGMTSITWLSDDAVMSDPVLEYSSGQTMDNSNSAAEVAWTESLTESKTRSWSFEDSMSVGFSLSVTTTIESGGGVPFLGGASASVSVETSFSTDMSWTSTRGGETTQEISKEISVSVGPYETVECKMQIYSGKLYIPYLATYQGLDEYGLYYTSNVTGMFTTDYFFGNEVVCNDLASSGARTYFSVTTVLSACVVIVLSVLNFV